MTKAEKILNDVIDTYCGGVYSTSRMSAVDYSMALEAVNQALQQSVVMKSVCPICKGSGKVQQTDIDWDDCRRCNGTGQTVS